MKRFLILLSIFVLALPIDAKSEIEHDPIKIVIFGDSLVSGYGIDDKEGRFKAVLEKKLKNMGYESISVFNAASPGLTTEAALQQTNKVIELNPSIVILALGSNDAFTKVPVRTIYTNLTKIILLLKKKNIKILLVGVNLPKSLGKEYYSKFSGMYGFLSDNYKIPLYPDLLNDVYGNPKMVNSDTIHPNKEGTELIINRIYPHPYIKSLIIQKFKEIMLAEKIRRLKGSRGR